MGILLCHSVGERYVLAVKQERKDPVGRALNTMLFLKQPNEAGLPAHCTDAHSRVQTGGWAGVERDCIDPARLWPQSVHVFS